MYHLEIILIYDSFIISRSFDLNVLILEIDFSTFQVWDNNRDRFIKTRNLDMILHFYLHFKSTGIDDS